jgi:cytoskeleton protein RodZ
MEKEDFSKLPADAYVKVFLRTYAKFLGLNPDEIISIYNSSSTEKKNERPIVIPDIKVRETKKQKKEMPESVKKGILALVGLLFLLSIAYAVRSCSCLPGRPADAINSENSTNLPPLILELETTGESWIEVVADVNAPDKMLMKAGDKKTWEANDEFRLLIGKKDSVKITFNGKPVDLTKKQGELIKDFVLKREVTGNGK